jgi:type IV pilus assembly protein PilA
MLLKNDKSSKQGFTLIELLVVISIIAILAAVGLVIYGSVQKNGRVSKRIQDLKALKLAAEQYKVDQSTYATTVSGGFAKWYVFPLQGGATCAAPAAGTGTAAVETAVVPALAPNYIASLPLDPSDGCYAYISDAQNYKIIEYGASEMKSADYQKQPSYYDTTRITGSPAVYSDWTTFNDPTTTSAW